MEIPDRKSCEGSMKLFKKSSLPELSLSTFLLFGKIFFRHHNYLISAGIA